MKPSEQKFPDNFTASESDPTKMDPCAPAGSKTSLGAQSVRDGRPSTGDEVVEAMDEGGPGVPTP